MYLKFLTFFLLSVKLFFFELNLNLNFFFFLACLYVI